MNEITIENFELTENDLFYSGYVYGNYFFDIESIIQDLLLSDYYQFMY